MKSTTTLLLSFALMAVLAAPASAGVNIIITNADGANEGFNDPTPVAPVGGNSGTTLGQQRMIAFAYAASIWAEKLDSNVDIQVFAQFNPLATNVLGSAGSVGSFVNEIPTPPYPGMLFPDSLHSAALADKRVGRDLAPTTYDLQANFSTNFDFYLGLDNNHGAKNDLVAVLLHELGHGLGFQNFVSEQNGLNGLKNGVRYTDVYSQYTLDVTTGLTWSFMTTAQRLASALNNGNVGWTGLTVGAALPSVLSLGSPFVTVGSNEFEYGTAAFGPPTTVVPVNGPVVYANDGFASPAVPASPGVPAVAAGTVNDGCESFPANSLAGKVALIDRGTCAFVIKAKNAQDAGAIGVILGNNTAAIPAMAGSDPSVTIPTISVSLPAANTIRSLIPVNASSSFYSSQYAGATPGGLARLYMPAVFDSGSSGSHYDTIARRNLLMEPSINPDLTHSIEPPEDLTLPLMRDIGWFEDADVDGLANDIDEAPESDLRPTVILGGCDSGVPNPFYLTGATLTDRILALKAAAANHGLYMKSVNDLLNGLKATGALTDAQKDAITSCAASNK
jgi:hypothetical protein